MTTVEELKRLSAMVQDQIEICTFVIGNSSNVIATAAYTGRKTAFAEVDAWLQEEIKLIGQNETHEDIQ